MDFYDILGEDPNDPKIKAAQIAHEQVENFFNTLIQIRKTKGITQAQLAEMLETDQAVISRIENYRNPTLGTIIEYAIALGVEIKLDASIIQPTTVASFTLTKDVVEPPVKVTLQTIQK